MLKTKKSYLVILMALALSACNGESDSPLPPTDPVDPVDPTDPVDPVDPIDPTDPTLPTDPELSITNNARDYPVELPKNPMSKLTNVIVHADNFIIAPDADPDIKWVRYSDNEAPVKLFSKNELTEEEIGLSKNLDVYASQSSIEKVTAYNTEEQLPTYFYTAINEVQESIENRLASKFLLYSSTGSCSTDTLINNLYSGSNAVSCLIAIDYNNHLTGDSLNILTDEEFSDIQTLQNTRTSPEKVSPYVINTVMRNATLDDTVRKSNITISAVSTYSLYPDSFTNAESVDNLEYICHGSSSEFEVYVNSMQAIYEDDDSNVSVEVEFKREEDVTYADQNKLVLTGMIMSDLSGETNLITTDIVDNLVIKQMMLNKIFNWNGDGYSFLSKHSFKNSEFTGLFEGIAAYYAGQKYTDRQEIASCNPADITSNCTYPRAYADYGLFVSYLLSADDNDTTIQREKEQNLIAFLKNLEVYNAKGCGLTWEDVDYDQVEMSNRCIEIAFDEIEVASEDDSDYVKKAFTTPSGNAITWNDLKTNWYSILTDYKANITALPLTNQNEILTFGGEEDEPQ